ncbi:MAG TPA: ribbon-helix-helix domain-containing protein [Nitrospiraceae bacterium]|nr:ribbon-helix-helix domain-containing protein [Nitrospiraceae bacterium]
MGCPVTSPAGSTFAPWSIAPTVCTYPGHSSRSFVWCQVVLFDACLTPLHPFDTVRGVTDAGESKTKRQIGPRVDESLTKEVRILAIREGRGFNDLIEEALRDLLKKYQAKKGLLPKGK